MGYSITHEQYEKLERYRREGRQCAMSTRGGGCFSRATLKVTQESYVYKLDEGPMQVHDMTLCARHGRQLDHEGGGVNFRVIKVEKI